jgi:hypothetical protein
MNWKDIEDTIKPKHGQMCICYCPGWCPLGYQVAKWDKRHNEFNYDDAPNPDFPEHVIAWAVFNER